MPLPQPTNFSQRFHQQLEQTRARIETLPQEWRSCFRALADQAEEYHRSMAEDCQTVRDLVDDMRLNEASVKFDLWCAAQNLRTLFAQERAPRTA
jgi:hypothetical protein